MAQKIGFVGIGVMGKSMARNLKKAGYEVSVYTRTKSKAEELLNEGIAWCETPGECAAGKHAVITMVGYPKDVEDVYFAPDGIMQSAEEGTFIIDMTTTDPAISVRIAEAAGEKKLRPLDAPVSGGDTGAQNGTLSIMVGGSREDFEACLPIFQAMGKSINYTGKAGSGQHTKMANQVAIAGAISGVCEAIAYAERNGLDVENMLSCVSAGAAGSWQMSNMAPRIARDDLNPGFYMKHYIKDLNIALGGNTDGKAPLAVTRLVRDMYQELAQQGLENLGTQALIRRFR